MSVDITLDMIAKCIHEKVFSDTFDFTPEQEAEYRNMPWRGRDLYDNLRTQFEVGHNQAFSIASDMYGVK